MMLSTTATGRAPLVLVLVAYLGAAAALIGGYWDDAWHTERGRDDFFIGPHIAIYAGIALAGASLTLWALLVARRQGPREVWAHKPLVLALLSVSVTLASGPIDNLWHLAFGRDAVVWSPPHMLGIAGTLALAASLLVELASRPERWAIPLSVVAGALVIAPAAFSTVEYDTDVPQFSELWYLPVLGFAAAIAFAMVRLASPLRWAATLSASVYTLFMAGVGLVLSALDFPPPAMPLLLAPAIAVDLGARRPCSPAVTALAFAVLLYAAYVPARNWLGEGVEITTLDVALGLPLTASACWAVFAIAAGPIPVRRVAVAAAVLAVLALPGSALAHDPGQGDDAGTANVIISLEGDQATLTAELAPLPCARTTPSSVVARRGGETRRAPLEQSGCRFEGSIVLPERGRWFVYAQMRRDGRPITAGSGPQRVTEEGRYLYFPPEQPGGSIQLVAGAVLYFGMLALFVAAFALIRRSSPAPA
jgi:hypothetical protein